MKAAERLGLRCSHQRKMSLCSDGGSVDVLRSFCDLYIVSHTAHLKLVSPLHLNKTNEVKKKKIANSTECRERLPSLRLVQPSPGPVRPCCCSGGPCTAGQPRCRAGRKCRVSGPLPRLPQSDSAFQQDSAAPHPSGGSEAHSSMKSTDRRGALPGKGESGLQAGKELSPD